MATYWELHTKVKSEQSVIHKRGNSRLQQRLLNKSFSFKALVTRTIQTGFHNADHNYYRAGHFQQESQKAESFELTVLLPLQQ